MARKAQHRRSGVRPHKCRPQIVYPPQLLNESVDITVGEDWAVPIFTICISARGIWRVEIHEVILGNVGQDNLEILRVQNGTPQYRATFLILMLTWEPTRSRTQRNVEHVVAIGAEQAVEASSIEVDELAA